MISPYKAGNYHLNETKSRKYFQRVEKLKIKKMQIDTQSHLDEVEEQVKVRGSYCV